MFVCVSNPLSNSHVIQFLVVSISRALNTPLAMMDYQRKNNDQQLIQLLSAKSDEKKLSKTNWFRQKKPGSGKKTGSYEKPVQDKIRFRYHEPVLNRTELYQTRFKKIQIVCKSRFLIQTVSINLVWISLDNPFAHH
jgi:hypothetical protein